MNNNLKNLPSISEIIKLYGLAPDKRLGQNFLSDQSITDQIVRHAGSLRDKYVLEIGPGPGLLTRSLIYSDAKKIFAVEKDERCIKALQQLVGISESRLEVINQDALTLDENKLTDSKLMVIANLPYNIGTTLILKWLENPQKFEHIIVMLQKEVVQRITANAGDDHFGRLAILTNLLCDTEVLFDVDPEHFYPAPKVISTVVRISPLPKKRYDCNIKSLSKLTAAAFGQRRKMLRSSLKSVVNDPDALLTSLGIDAGKRAEQLTVQEFCIISNALENS